MDKHIKNKFSRTKKSKMTAPVKSEDSPHSAFWSLLIKTGALISFYYVTSIGLTFYQSWLMKKFYYPLSVVLIHFVIKFSLAGLCRQVYTWYTGLERITLGWSNFITRVAVIALVASLDIGLSQWSFEYIQVALYTITKSTSIIFILFFAIIFKLEKKHWSLIVIVLVISLGLIMFTYESTDFSLIGFLMVLSASFLSGIRWTLSQLIMQKSSLGLSNPLDMVFHVQPIMILALLPFAIAFEGVGISASVAVFRFSNVDQLIHTICLISGGGVLAFLMEVAEFMLVTFTSSLTLSMAGIVKEIISLTLAVVFQSNEMSVINAIGLVVCLSGITLHVVRKATAVENKEKSPVYKKGVTSGGGGDYSIPLLSSDSDSSDEIYHATGLRSRSVPTEDTLLQDHRQWTSVRDSHIRGVEESPPLHVENYSALQEADLIIDQLDLMSSD